MGKFGDTPGNITLEAVLCSQFSQAWKASSIHVIASVEEDVCGRELHYWDVQAEENPFPRT